MKYYRGLGWVASWCGLDALSPTEGSINANDTEESRLRSCGEAAVYFNTDGSFLSSRMDTHKAQMYTKWLH